MKKYSLVLVILTLISTSSCATLEDFRKKVFKFSNRASGNKPLYKSI